MWNFCEEAEEYVHDACIENVSMCTSRLNALSHWLNRKKEGIGKLEQLWNI